MSEREHAHELIDRMPDLQVAALVGLLETIVDHVAAALRNVPMDDELETESEMVEVSEAREWIKRNGGKGVPHEEAMAGLVWSEGDRMDRGRAR
jgi:hypothetical protein